MAPGPLHPHRTLSDMLIHVLFFFFLGANSSRFWPSRTGLGRFAPIQAESHWFGPIRTNSGRVALVQHRFRLSRAVWPKLAKKLAEIHVKKIKNKNLS